ncbi:unnamed protein product [Calicophoron daubneyi]|uniref:Uncharacterized protein n=1 Tax=Calicophoron daubneyi TaxID=300641 RepID=A0AAV2T0Y4_CALDB
MYMAEEPVKGPKAGTSDDFIREDITKMRENVPNDSAYEHADSYRINQDELKSWALDPSPNDYQSGLHRRRNRKVTEENVYFDAESYPDYGDPAYYSGKSLNNGAVYNDYPLKDPIQFESECGCPHLNSPANLVSSHEEEYLPRFPEVERPVRPSDQLYWPTGTIDGETTYRHDYIPYPLSDRSFPTPRKQIDVQTNEPMQRSTTYSDDYVPYEAEPTMNFKPNSIHLPPVEPLEDQSVYRTEYQPYDIEMPSNLRPLRQYTRPIIPMCDFSTYRMDYPPKEFPQKGEPYKPKDRTSFLSGGRTGISSYTEEFVAKRAQISKDYKPKHKYQPPEQPMEDWTVYRSDYVPQPLEVQDSFAPRSLYRPPRVSFAQQTSYRHDFVPYEMEKSLNFKPICRYSAPAVRMDNASTYKTDYPGVAGERSRPVKHLPQYQPPDEEYPKQTTYTADYEPKACEKTLPYKAIANLGLSTQPTDDRTMYRSEYIPYDVPARISFKPRQDYIKPTENMEDRTTYRVDYVPKYSLGRGYADLLSKNTHNNTKTYSDAFQQGRNGPQTLAGGCHNQQVQGGLADPSVVPALHPHSAETIQQSNLSVADTYSRRHKEKLEFTKSSIQLAERSRRNGVSKEINTSDVRKLSSSEVYRSASANRDRSEKLQTSLNDHPGATQLLSISKPLSAAQIRTYEQKPSRQHSAPQRSESRSSSCNSNTIRMNANTTYANDYGVPKCWLNPPVSRDQGFLGQTNKLPDKPVQPVYPLSRQAGSGSDNVSDSVKLPPIVQRQRTYIKSENRATEKFMSMMASQKQTQLPKIL